MCLAANVWDLAGILYRAVRAELSVHWAGSKRFDDRAGQTRNRERARPEPEPPILGVLRWPFRELLTMSNPCLYSQVGDLEAERSTSSR
jgi:hypothetical protein